MGDGKIKITDIAQMAGVSATTVSNVIHGRTDKVSKQTKKRVEEILDEQGYIPSMGARMLSGKSSRMIAVVVRKKEDWRWAEEELGELLQLIEKCLYEKRYYVLLHFLKTADEFLTYEGLWKLDGIICIWLGKEEFIKIKNSSKIPAVELPKTGEIYVQAGKMTASFLLKRGTERIWFLDGTEYVGKEIWKGIQKVCGQKEIVMEEERYLEIPKDKELRKMFYKIRLAALAFSAEALVFASGRQAAEAIGYLTDMQIRIPEEIKVIGIGNEEQAQICRPQLTTVEINKEAVVKRVVEDLFQKLIEGYRLTKNGKSKVKMKIRESFR